MRKRTSIQEDRELSDRGKNANHVVTCEAVESRLTNKLFLPNSLTKEWNTITSVVRCSIDYVIHRADHISGGETWQIIQKNVFLCKSKKIFPRTPRQRFCILHSFLKNRQ